VVELLDLLREQQDFLSDDGTVNHELVVELNRTLRPLNLHLAADGTVVEGSSLGVEPSRMLDGPAVREHIRRLDLALAIVDVPLLLGSSKELLEAASKLVLDGIGEPIPDKFPSLLTRALEALGLHARAVAGDTEVAGATRRILGGLHQIGLGVNELRNDHGTGHGRIDNGTRLSLRHARLAAGAAAVLATVMVDTFEDPDAPWRGRRPPGPA
jgi:hypothetical protein